MWTVWCVQSRESTVHVFTFRENTNDYPKLIQFWLHPKYGKTDSVIFLFSEYAISETNFSDHSLRYFVEKLWFTMAETFSRLPLLVLFMVNKLWRIIYGQQSMDNRLWNIHIEQKNRNLIWLWFQLPVQYNEIMITWDISLTKLFQVRKNFI